VSRALYAGLAALAAAGGGALLWRSKATARDAPSRPSAGPLSARRLQALAIVAEVVPSAYGAPGESGERFAKLAPGFKAETIKGELVLTANGVKLPPTFTTCGYLPCYLGRRLALAKEIGQCGLEQLRMNGRAWGAWVEPGEGREPRPGDPFGIDQQGGGLIVHVGVYVGKNPDGTWRTADAGQGTKERQEAKYLSRPYNPAAKTIGGPAGPRPLAGWVDLDKVPAVGIA
jgi:hypothetical protein